MQDGAKLEEAKPEPEVAATEDMPGPAGHEEAPSPSTFELARRVLVGVVQAIEDGADLVGASVREELGQFKEDLLRGLAGVLLVAIGAGLVTAGLALLLHGWFGSWPPVLLVLGGIYLAVGGWLCIPRRDSGGDR